MCRLTAERILDLEQQVDRLGYAVLPGIVSKAQLAEVNAELVDAYERSVKFEGGGTISGHLNCFPGEVSRPVYHELEKSGLVDVVRSMRKGRSSGVRAHVNFNLPGSSAQHYHMDGVFVDAFPVCHVAVVDTDVDNGAIDVLPATHREFYPFWRYAIHRKYRLSTRVPLRRGDVLVRWSSLWHRGMPNGSEAPRPMMSFTFGEKSAPIGDPFSGEIGFYPNWYSNASRMGVVRERVEVAAPITRSAVRFVRSLRSERGYSSY